MQALKRSIITQPGGKYYSVKHILPEFPDSGSYDAYCEPFAGSAVLLLNKPQVAGQIEIINDANGDLVNFWMQCRDHPKELEEQIASLPYSRRLFSAWQTSLFDASIMTDMERAVRWFYVLRSSLGCRIRKSGGNWGYEVVDRPKSAITFRNAPQLFAVMAERLKYVQIECGGYADVMKRYSRASTFFYVDPPYISTEKYFHGARFGAQDHRHLAARLNETPALVALSYYPHPLIDDLYPADKWRRITWSVWKSLERKQPGAVRQAATEMLLCNY